MENDLQQKKENKTYRVRDTVLKAYYHLRAKIKIESEQKTNESFILQIILQEGFEAIQEIEKENKNIYINHYSDERYSIGGLVDPELHKQFKIYNKKYGWKMQEICEICIFFCAKKRFNKNEQIFFELETWRIVIV